MLDGCSTATHHLQEDRTMSPHSSAHQPDTILDDLDIMERDDLDAGDEGAHLHLHDERDASANDDL